MGASAVEVVAVTALHPDFTHRRQEIGSTDLGCIREPDPAAPPNEGHPVLGRHPGAVERASNLVVALSFYQAVDRRAADVFATTLFAPSLERRGSSSKIDRR